MYRYCYLYKNVLCTVYTPKALLPSTVVMQNKWKGGDLCTSFELQTRISNSQTSNKNKYC